MIRKKFRVKGMTCTSCSSHVEHSVKSLDGVLNVEVNLMAATMIVEYDEEKVSDAIIIETVNSGGFNASIYIKGERLNEENELENKRRLYSLIASIVLMIILMYFSMGEMLKLPFPNILKNHQTAYFNGIIQIILLIPIIILNKHYFTNGYKRLFKLAPNMDSLVALGSTFSLIYGLFATIMQIKGVIDGDNVLIERYHMELYFESSGMILTLVSLGKYVENRSKGKTTKSISKLLDLTPKKGLILKDNEEIQIDVDDIKIGDVLIVKPGENIPIDGIVIRGITSVNESTLTGEAIPVLKEENSVVRSGTINLTGVIYIKATCESNDTTLQKIIDLVDVASSSKAPLARLADKVSLYFVPIVLLISLITFIIWMIIYKDFEFAFSRSVSVLVISCPCALGLATPVAIMIGTYKGVDYGILIKSGTALEELHDVDTIVFDKTGTITNGKPTITDLIAYDISEEELLQIAYSLERNSEHPLSLSINEFAQEKNIESFTVSNFENVVGKGIKGIINDKLVYCGSKSYLNHNIDNDLYERLSNDGKTVIFVFTDEKLYGLIALKDEIKSTSKDAILELKKMNIKSVMLTGDNEGVAKTIAKECEIDEVIAGVMPEDKAMYIEKIKSKGSTVAMVGDGINDSVALSTATIGIAMGSGTDVAIESAGVVLMKNDLTDVICAIKLSKTVIKNIKTNLFWAFFYNTLFIPVAAGLLYPFIGLTLSPMICALAMSMSSICVVLNALRINNFKKEKIYNEKSNSN